MYVCMYVFIFLDDPDNQQQTLPQLELEKSTWCSWWSMVKRIAEMRPSVETIVISALIVALHHPQCECTCKHQVLSPHVILVYVVVKVHNEKGRCTNNHHGMMTVQSRVILTLDMLLCM